MADGLTISQLAEDQSKQGSELLAVQAMITAMLKALGPTFAAPIFEQSKNTLALFQNRATGPLGTGYIEDAILIVEQIEGSVSGKPGPSGVDRFGATAAFAFPKEANPVPPVDRT